MDDVNQENLIIDEVAHNETNSCQTDIERVISLDEADIRNSDIFKELEQNYIAVQNDYEMVEEAQTALKEEMTALEKDRDAHKERADKAEASYAKINKKYDAARSEIEKLKSDIGNLNAILNSIADMAGSRRLQVPVKVQAPVPKKTSEPPAKKPRKVAKPRETPILDIKIGDANFDRHCRCGKVFGNPLNLRRHFLGLRNQDRCWQYYTLEEIQELYKNCSDLKKAQKAWTEFHKREASDKEVIDV